MLRISAGRASETVQLPVISEIVLNVKCILKRGVLVAFLSTVYKPRVIRNTVESANHLTELESNHQKF